MKKFFALLLVLLLAPMVSAQVYDYDDSIAVVFNVFDTATGELIAATTAPKLRVYKDSIAVAQLHNTEATMAQDSSGMYIYRFDAPDETCQLIYKFTWGSQGQNHAMTVTGPLVANIWDASTDGVIVTTNNDKTDYALSTAGVLAFWNVDWATAFTAGSMGDSLSDPNYVQGTASGLTAAEVSDSVWAKASAPYATAGTFGNHLYKRIFDVATETVDVGAISGDPIAADSLEAMLDGTGISLFLRQLTIKPPDGNKDALVLQGDGTGNGLDVRGGDQVGDIGSAIYARSGLGGGAAITVWSDSGNGISITGQKDGNAIRAEAVDSGSALYLLGGDKGSAATNPSGAFIRSRIGDGVYIAAGTGDNRHAIEARGGTGSGGDAIRLLGLGSNGVAVSATSAASTIYTTVMKDELSLHYWNTPWATAFTAGSMGDSLSDPNYVQGTASGLTPIDFWNVDFASVFTAGSMGDSLNNPTWIRSDVTLSALNAGLAAVIDTTQMMLTMYPGAKYYNDPDTDVDYQYVVLPNGDTIITVEYWRVGGAPGDAPDTVKAQAGPDW